MSSDRVAVHFTGRPSLRAHQQASTSSPYTCSLEPKPPPTSGATTRILSSVIPSWIERITRQMCGICVELQRVSLPSRHSASAARGSIAAPAVRWLTIRFSTTTSASRKAASMSPPASDHSNTLLVPNSSWMIGAPSSSACSGSTTTGSGSYSTSTCSAASTTPYLSLPTTTATGWPTYLTTPLASGQVSGVLTSTPGGIQTIGSGASSL